MYGIVNKALKAMILAQEGQEVWEQILDKAGLENPVFIGTDNYPDEWTYRLASTASEKLNLPLNTLLGKFGEFWATHTAVEEYPELMATGGGNLKDFLINLPNFHTQVVLMLPQLEPPDFQCEVISEICLHMHYFSTRQGLAPFALGIFKGLGKVFQENIQVKHIEQISEAQDHDVFEISWSQSRSE